MMHVYMEMCVCVLFELWKTPPFDMYILAGIYIMDEIIRCIIILPPRNIYGSFFFLCLIWEERDDGIVYRVSLSCFAPRFKSIAYIYGILSIISSSSSVKRSGGVRELCVYKTDYFFVN